MNRQSYCNRLDTTRSASVTSIGLRLLYTILFLPGIQGCGLLPFYTAANVELVEGAQPFRTRATDEISFAEFQNGVFVGIAMSGGGSRAANFSTAILLELEEMGFLDAATALSSVSGSSLSAAYYGLFGNERNRWNREKVRQSFLTDFQTHWLARWFFPPYMFAYWITDFDRSDIMKAVFDRFLFQGKTFKDMGEIGPKILINATSLISEKKFVFTEKEFRNLHSRIDTFPVSEAVMASGAFPGAFHNVTVRNFRAESYVHLFDGGPSDNLGIETLLSIVQRLYAAETKPRGCFLFIADAYTAERGKGAYEHDTRRFTDFLIDDNVMDSADVMLNLRRAETLEKVNITRPAVTSYSEFNVPGRTDKCSVWHLSFEGLLRLGNRAREVRKVVNQIDTAYRLQASSSDERFTAQQLQNYLFEAAHILIREDTGHLRQTCQWFVDRGFTNMPCREVVGVTK